MFRARTLRLAALTSVAICASLLDAGHVTAAAAGNGTAATVPATKLPTAHKSLLKIWAYQWWL